MSGGLRIASIKGVPITVHSTALILAAVYAWLWAGVFPPERFGAGTTIAVGTAAVIGVSLSILLHELGHVVAGRVIGIRAVDVSLWGLGGMARFASLPRNGGGEVLLSAAGPAVSLALGFLLYAGSWATEPQGPTTRAAFVVWYMLSQLGWWNIFIGLLNLAPGPPLDGGGVVRGIAWAATRDRRTGMRVSAISGLVTAAIAGVAVVTRLGERVLPGSDLMLLFVAFLLVMGALPILRKESDRARQDLDERNRLLQDAARIAHERHDAVIGSLHLLIALSRCGIEPLASFLYRNGVTADRIGLAAPADREAQGNPETTPVLSEGARRILEESLGNGGGVLGVFLALPDDSQAGVALERLDLHLGDLKTEILAPGTA